ncbi:MAG: hypothetical protein QOG54_2031 [Actinomycetota bacterium]|jgi:hypothetical protein|nr:hypothetical protein [Actinomycetota bacterium]
MATTTLTERAPGAPQEPAGPSRLDRILGHPLVFVGTALVLLLLYAWPFISDPGRVAPTKDPAFYTWRTETLISENPADLLKVEGAFGMFAAGYRVTAPVLGGFLRQIAGVAPLDTTLFFMIGLPVLTALLLAGFAYSKRRDPLLFHSVAFAAGGLFLTPPFIGYLDNVLCLFFLAASLFFLEGARDSWPARLGFGLFLVLSGMTHPTTLVIFCFVLGAMSIGRLIYRKFDLRSVIRDDGPMLLTAFISAVLTFAIWTIGIWGKSVSLSEAALPPPYGVDFFVDRMVLWVKAMRPLLNGPLFVIGAVGLLAAGRRAAEDELARVSVVWLVPLAGLFGFIAGVAYPYYRFFNTTLAWVLLVGVGGWFVMRFLIGISQRGGIATLALVGVLAVVFVLATNFTKGFEVSGWTNPHNEWLSPDEQRDLDYLRAALAEEADPDRPVVFVVDDADAAKTFQIWGVTKLAGNTSRYGLPPGQIDQGYLYLGSLQNFLDGKPTLNGTETYDKLSPALLEDAQKGIEESGQEPLIVVAQIFNPTGANSDVTNLTTSDPNVWILTDQGVVDAAGSEVVGPEKAEPVKGANPIRILLALILLSLPGYIAYRGLMPDAELPEALGLVPALAAGLLALAGIIVLAVTRSPFSSGHAWISFVVAAVIASVVGLRSGAGLPFTDGRTGTSA